MLGQDTDGHLKHAHKLVTPDKHNSEQFDCRPRVLEGKQEGAMCWCAYLSKLECDSAWAQWAILQTTLGVGDDGAHCILGLASRLAIGNGNHEDRLPELRGPCWAYNQGLKHLAVQIGAQRCGSPKAHLQSADLLHSCTAWPRLSARSAYISPWDAENFSPD